MISKFRQKVQDSSDWGKPEPVQKARPAAYSPPTYLQIIAHRLFPVFAALWFAALFGLGSLAISGQALGSLVTAIGLPALVPAAAPPLGFTAHVLVALVLTMLGGGLGLVVGHALGLRLRPQTAPAARPVAAASFAPETADSGVPKVRARDAHPDAPPRRPLVLTEAFAQGAEAAIAEPDAPEAPVLRRKPGQVASEVLASEPEAWIPVYTPGGESVLPPFDLALACEALPELAGGAPESSIAPVSEPESAAVPTLLAATPQVPAGFTLAQPSRNQRLAGEPWSPVASAALDSLGLVQLIERLALAIAARKAVSDAGPPPTSEYAMPDSVMPDSVNPVAATPFAQPAAVAPTNNEPSGSAREAILRRLGTLPAHMLPSGTAAPELAANPAPFNRPQSSDAVLPWPPAERHHTERSAATPVPSDLQGAPGSGPFAAPGARIAAVPPETDAALRAALATLQRMTARG